MTAQPEDVEEVKKSLKRIERNCEFLVQNQARLMTDLTSLAAIIILAFIIVAVVIYLIQR